jgi:thioredoxin-like negative regulator of GroEL
MYNDMITVSKQNFEELIQSKSPVVLIFWSKNNPSCLQLIETMKSLSAKYRDSVKFGLVNVDLQSELANQLGVEGLPCVIIIHNGRLCSNISGALPLSHYKNIIDDLIYEKGEKSNFIKRLLKLKQ